MQKIYRLVVLIVLLAVSPISTALAEPDRGIPIFDVNTTSDLGDNNPGDCKCVMTGTSTFCSLRAAFEEAKACAGDNDIMLDNGITYTISSYLEASPASMLSTETINLYTNNRSGERAIIKGTGTENYQAINLAYGTMNIDNITISDSNGITMLQRATLNMNNVLMMDNHNIGDINDYRSGGGAIENNDSFLTITNSTFNNNNSVNGCGGAINNSGELIVENSTFVSNVAARGGAICHIGFTFPNPETTWTFTIRNSTFSSNAASYQGGGLFVSGPSFNGEYNLVEHSLFSGNQSIYGGGIFLGPSNVDPWGGGMILMRSTLSENIADYGAGMAVGNTANISFKYNVYIENSTISGNPAEIHGGGIYMGQVYTIEADPTVAVSSSTITNNTADRTGSQSGNGGGIYNGTNNVLRLENTILAGNLDASTGISIKAPDCWGGINLEGYNLIGRSGGCDIDTDGSSQIGNSSNPINPLLEPLGLYGYDILTHGLTAGSPAINRGNPLGCKNPSAQQIAIDQRGEPRVYDDGRCDIGAVEAQFHVKKVFLPAVLR